MGSFQVNVSTAFSLTEVLQHGRALRADLVEAEENDAELWSIVNLLQNVANSVWVPRLMTVADQRQLDALCNETHLTVHRNALAPREESVSLITPGLANDLRVRVAAEISASIERSGDLYHGLSDRALWAEVLREAAVDWAFRAVRSGFEIRGCAQCGRWYEPQLANRSRFCTTDCRKKFNNLRAAKQKAYQTFHCGGCGRDLSMNAFSGLHREHKDDTVTPLRIQRYIPLIKGMRCLECVQDKNPEWNRYIAPLLEARERTAAS